MINIRLLYYLFKILDLASNSVIRIISLTQWKIISNPQPPSSNPLPWKGEIIGDAKIPQNQDCKLKNRNPHKNIFPFAGCLSKIFADFSFENIGNQIRSFFWPAEETKAKKRQASVKKDLSEGTEEREARFQEEDYYNEEDMENSEDEEIGL